MSDRRLDPDAFRDAVLSRLDGVESKTAAPRLDRDARRTLVAVVCVVVVVGAGGLWSRWSQGSASEAASTSSTTSIEGAFQRLSVDPVDEDAPGGNQGESATEAPGERYEEVVAAAPGRST